MPIITKYARVPIEELLSLCEDKRAHSSIIEELCQRIEGNDTLTQDGFQSHAECPVCESPLLIEENETNTSYNVTVAPH